MNTERTSFFKRYVRTSTLIDRWEHCSFIEALESTRSGYPMGRVRRAVKRALDQPGWGRRHGLLALKMVACMPRDPQNSLYNKLWKAVLDSGVLKQNEGYALLDQIADSGAAEGVLFNLITSAPGDYRSALHQLLDRPGVTLQIPEDPRIRGQLRDSWLGFLRILEPAGSKAYLETCKAKGLTLEFWQDQWGFLPHRIEASPDQALAQALWFKEDSVEERIRVYLDGGWPVKAMEAIDQPLEPIIDQWLTVTTENSTALQARLPEELNYFVDELRKIDDEIGGRNISDLSDRYRGERAQIRQKFDRLGGEFKELCVLRSVLERRLCSLDHVAGQDSRVPVLQNETRRMIEAIDETERSFDQFLRKHDNRFNPPPFIYDKVILDEWKTGEFQLELRAQKRKRLRRAVDLAVESSAKRPRGNDRVIVDSEGEELVLPSDESDFWDEAFDQLKSYESERK